MGMIEKMLADRPGDPPASAADAGRLVAERWVVTVPVGHDRASRLAGGLKPLAVGGHCWMALAIDRLETAWGASLRLLCADRDGSGPVSLHLGDYGAGVQPKFRTRRLPALRVDQGYDWYRRPYLTIATGDNRVGLRIVEHPFVALESPEPGLADQRVLRFSLGEGRALLADGSAADCHLDAGDPVRAMSAYHGILRTAEGSWPVRHVDVYRNFNVDWRPTGPGAGDG